MTNLRDTNVLITGGGSGLARVLVGEFVREGAGVGVLEYVKERVDELKADFGDKVVAVQGDVRSLDDNRRAVSETVQAFGHLDSFIGVAGISEFTMAFSQMPPEKISETFDEVMGVNVKGYLLGVMAALPELRKTEGSVVLTLSPAGFFPGGGGPVYTLSKHAGVGLLRQLAYELAPTVRVNAVSPGAVPASDLRGPQSLNQRDTSLSAIPTAMREEMNRQITPLRFYPDTTGYFPPYALLAGKDSKLTTGAILHWDQGTQVVGFGLAGLQQMADQEH